MDGSYRSFGSIPTREGPLEEDRALKARVAELRARIVDPEGRLGRNPRNSSRPPSSSRPFGNAAERAVRPGVLRRKGAFGTDSARGSRFVERVMTVAATCRRQGRNVLEYVTRACEATLHCETAPSLLPEPMASALNAAA